MQTGCVFEAERCVLIFEPADPVGIITPQFGCTKRMPPTSDEMVQKEDDEKEIYHVICKFRVPLFGKVIDKSSHSACASAE